MSSEPFLVTGAVVMKPDGTLLLARRPAYPHVGIHPLAFLVDSRSGELVLHAHDDHRLVSLSDVEPLPSLRAEVQR